MKINQFYVPAISLFLILSSCKENHANAQKTGNDGSVETEILILTTGRHFKDRQELRL
ncbi:hypothetical protein [Chryseobacterium gleum]|uniref:hypothetical protein n=1 Tax=Chryseobacterium gleum TaxID=250 RepID=UPI0028AF16E4|nr:hypothetical protein [Chryseobacterium gleum]